MAQYKVPQDVEAEDKLLGPFTFRQFIYLIITFASIALCWGLFQLFPLLAIIPLPVVIFFAILALPLKKDQPMETYLAAIVSFYLKPHKRFWTSGQKESTILITAPKIVEKPRTRNITQEEAGHRLSFLADLVDTEGYSIRNANTSSVRAEYVAEANSTVDIFDSSTSSVINRMIVQDQNARHAELVAQMRTAIKNTEEYTNSNPPTIKHRTTSFTSTSASTSPIIQPTNQTFSLPPTPTPSTNPNLVNLANNSVYSVETIQRQANRLQPSSNNPHQEVFISLH